MTTSPTETIRAFIAVRPNQPVYTELIRVQRELETAFTSSGLRIKWTDPETFHITLLFLGDIPANHVPFILQAMDFVQGRVTPPGVCALYGLGLFKRPGALRVGISAPPELLELQQRVCAALDMQPGRFHAHFTLGRIKAGQPDQTFFQTLENTKIQPVPFAICELELVKSELFADGALHSVLGSAHLSSPS